MSTELDPWADTPHLGIEVPKTIEAYQEEVKAGKTYLSDPALWEAAGYEIPVFEGQFMAVHMKAAQLLEDGLPCYMVIDGVQNFSITSMGERDAIITEMQKETDQALADQEYWENTPNRLKSVADMLVSPEIEWIVQDKIHRAGLFQIYGASYTGKTLAVLDLAMSWCAGMDNWQGYPLSNEGKPQEALYVAAEGGAALSVHIDAWLKYHEDVDPSRLSGLHFLDGGEGDNVFLSVGRKHKDDPGIPYTDSWSRLYKEVINKGIDPSLVIFDTQIDIAPGVDENSNTEMVGILREIKRLGDSGGFMAVVVHHTGHDGNKARGASGMMGKCDAQAKLTQIGEKSGKAKLEWTKVKGRALPVDDWISYSIQGWRELPDLDSEGAVCVPLDRTLAAFENLKPNGELASRIERLLTKAPLSLTQLAEKLEMQRNNKTLTDTLESLKFDQRIESVGKGRNTKLQLHPMAWVEAPSAES